MPSHAVKPPPRRWFAVAAAVTSFGSLAAMLARFEIASPRKWLAPAPDMLELVVRCEVIPQRDEREQCTRRVVTALLERQHPESMRTKR